MFGLVKQFILLEALKAFFCVNYNLQVIENLSCCCQYIFDANLKLKCHIWISKKVYTIKGLKGLFYLKKTASTLVI